MRLAAVLVVAGACASGRVDPYRECLAALDQVKPADGQAYRSAVRTCTHVFSQPTCRGALLRALDSSPDEKRAGESWEVCRLVYCPLFAAPRPAECDSTTADRAARDELHLAILRHDLGAERGTELDARMKRAFEVAFPPISLEPRGPCDGAMSIALRPGGVWLGTRAERRFVAACGDAVDKAALAAELCRLAHTPTLSCSEVASISADGSIAYAELVAAMDLAGKAGFSDVSVSDSVEVDFPAAAGPGQTVPAACGQEVASCPSRVTRARPALPADDTAIRRAPVITLDKNGGLSLDRKPLQLAALADALKSRSPAAAEVDRIVILQVDRAAPASQVKQLMTIAQAAGYANVQFAVSRASPM